MLGKYPFVRACMLAVAYALAVLGLSQAAPSFVPDDVVPGPAVSSASQAAVADTVAPH
jgi:hypothetical protein